MTKHNEELASHAAELLDMIRSHQYGLRGFGDGSLSRGRNLTDKERCTIEQALRLATAGEQKRCGYCDDTGDVHSIDGEWRGRCACPAGQLEQVAQDRDILNSKRWRFAFIEGPDWSYAVCKWDGSDWLPITTAEDVAELDAARARGEGKP